MKICDYGCGRKAIYKMKNGKWCCEKSYQACPNVKKTPWNKGKNGVYSEETLESMRKNNKKINKGKKWEDIFGEEKAKLLKKKAAERITMLNKTTTPWNKGVKDCFSEETKKIMSEKATERMNDELLRFTISKSLKRSINYYKKEHPFFYKIEKPREINNFIEVKCKKCGKWFKPTGIQLYERIRQLENINGNGGSYFYCSDDCKYSCPLWNLKGDPNKSKRKYYTNEEYQQFRSQVLERDKYICQYCGKKATYVHHERPQKLEPFFALDPDFAWSVCEKCHYKYGHNGECSTGKLSSIICI